MEFYTETREKEYLIPESIVLKTGRIEGEQVLLQEAAKQNVMGRARACTVKGKGALVFDFGQEYYGGVRILLGNCGMGSADANIRIRFGESLAECCAELGEKNTTNDHSTRDMAVYMSSNSDMEWGNTGYRYIRIDFLKDEEYRIHNVYGTFIHGKYPDAVYETSDETVNRLLEMSARTVFLNLQNYIWDGIKRDQHVWVGDLYPEVLGVFYLYKDTGIVKDTLDLILDSYPLPCWFNDIPSYNIWFILIVGVYYRLTGKRDGRYSEAVYKILRQFDGCIGEDGTLDTDKAGLRQWKGDFFDWPTFSSEKDSRAGVYYLLYYALTDVQRNALYGEDTRKLAREMAKKLDKREAEESGFKSVAALKVLSGKPDAGRSVAFIKDGGAKGYSSFLSYIISSALSESGETQAAFDNLAEYYGGMLKMGATTCWESFDVTWLENVCKITELPKEGEADVHGDRGADCYLGFRHSLCHGWSCGFLPFFVEKIVGFRYTDEACNKIVFEPALCGLRYVKAKIPTAKGMIEVEHRQTERGVETNYRLPEGIAYDLAQGAKSIEYARESGACAGC